MEDKKQNFVLSFSRTQGKKTEEQFKQVAEFTKEISSLVNSGSLNYVRDLLASHILNTSNMEERDKKAEEKKDFELRKLAEVHKEVVNMKDEELKETEVYKLLSSKDSLYKVCRNFLPCYVVQTEEDKKQGKQGKTFFAKEKVIAYRIAELSDEKKEKYKKNVLFKEELIETEEDKAKYFVRKGYEVNGHTKDKQVQRRQRYEVKKEQSLFIFKNGKIFVMEAEDKITFSDLFEMCSYHLQLEAMKAKEAQRMEEERLSRLANIADIIERKKAEYLEISSVIEKHLQLEKSKLNITSLTKKVNEAEDIIKKFDIQTEETDAIKKAKEIINEAKEEAKRKKEEKKKAKEAEANKEAEAEK